MTREEFIKYQEERIKELFPLEHRMLVAETAIKMLKDAEEQMKEEYGEDWRTKFD